MTALELAREDRRQRADELLDRQVDDRLDAVLLGTADVSPAARVKLKGILKRLAKQAHPFTQCMSDLREHKPEWSDDRRKKTCNVLKALSGRGDSKTNAAHLSQGGACLLLDDDVMTLLEMVDESALAALQPKGDS